LKLGGGERQPSSPDVFGKGDIGNKRKQPLEIIRRTAGLFRHGRHIDFIGQITIDIFYRAVHFVKPVHKPHPFTDRLA
jgi:hypothetical protein